MSSHDPILIKMRALLVASDSSALAFQYGCLLALTLFLVYSVALVAARRSTHVKSHGWIFMEACIAAGFCLLAFRLHLVYDWNEWGVAFGAVIPLNVLLLAIERGGSVTDVYRGRSLIDLRPGRPLFRTDVSLIRNSAMMSLFWLLGMVK